MKIYNLGLALDVGKSKYTTVCFDKLVKKFEPQKQTPYTIEILDSDIETADAIVYHPDKKLDLVVADLEKIETRLARSSDDAEIQALAKAQKLLDLSPTFHRVVLNNKCRNEQPRTELTLLLGAR